MLKFAYLSLRLKYKRKQKKNVDCYWFKDAINIQRYTHYYKSRQFLFDNQTNKDIEGLRKIEAKMSIENILHCRKNIFNNLLEENEKIFMKLKIFILIINIVLINGYCLKNVVKKNKIE
jgi:hypothetical protein